MRVERGGFQSPGGRIWGFPKRRGSLCGKFWLRGKSCRCRKLECAEELAGVKRPPARARLPALGHSFGGV